MYSSSSVCTASVSSSSLMCCSSFWNSVSLGEGKLLLAFPASRGFAVRVGRFAVGSFVLLVELVDGDFGKPVLAVGFNRASCACFRRPCCSWRLCVVCCWCSSSAAASCKVTMSSEDRRTLLQHGCSSANCASFARYSFAADPLVGTARVRRRVAALYWRVCCCYKHQVLCCVSRETAHSSPLPV